MSEWKTVSLGDVCVIDKSKYTDGDLPYVGMEDIVSGTGKFIGSREPRKAGSSTFQFTYDHLLYGRLRPYLNKVLLPDFEGHCSSEIFPLMPKAGLDKSFLFYWITSEQIVKEINRTCTGARMPRANVNEILKFDIPIPSLEEQKRIVAILDEAFTGIDSAIANTEKNLANARKLFDSYLNSVFTQKGEGWIEKQLGDICSITSKLVDPRDDKFIDLKHVGAGNIISFTGDLIQVQTARDEGLISGKFVFDEHMVLYSKIRPYLMKVVRPGFVGLCSADIYPLKPFADFLDRDFLYYLLLSNKFTKYAISGSERAGMPKVNREHLFQYSVALPEFSEQKRIAEQLDTMAIESQRIEIIYKQKLNSLKELKQSLLQKAFSGELTAAKATPEAILKEEEVA